MHDHMYGKRNDAIIRDFLGQHLTDEEVRWHSDEKERLYREMMLPQMSEALVPGSGNSSKDEGRPMAVASNANAVNVRFVLEEAGLASFFRVSVHGGQVKHAKPHPDIYLKAAELLGVPREACVVFEDSVTGVAAGLAAGMPVVGLATTHDNLEGVSLLVKDFRDPDLAAWLAKLG